MKIFVATGALMAFFVFFLSACLIQTAQAQSNVNAGNPGINNTPSVTPAKMDKAVVARKIRPLIYKKWDSDTWGKIKKILEESPSLFNERMGFLLHRAIAEGNLVAAEWFLTHGVDVNVKNDGGETPLFYVQDVKTARWLLEHGADVDVENVAGMTALYKILAIPPGAHRNGDDAQYRERENIAELLIANGADISQEDNAGNDFLHVLAMGEHYRWLGDCLKKGANPNRKNRAGQGLWLMPIARNQDDVTDWLESQGLKYDPRDEELVKTVVACGNKHIMKKLQKNGFEINKEDSKSGLMLLEAAVIKGNTNAFNMLLACGARGVNIKKVYNCTLPVRLVVENVEFTKHLIAQGYDVNTVDSTGRPALFSAILSEREDVVKVLLGNGADLNKEISVDSNAFSWVDKASHKIVYLKSVTPLVLAAYSFRKDVLETLLAHGADVNARTSEGYTALAVAEKIQNHKLADLLRKKGGVE